MKKVIKILVTMCLIIFVYISALPKTYAAMNPKLEDIVRIFNACKVVKTYSDDREKMSLFASSFSDDENKVYTLTIHISNVSSPTNLVYTLKEGSILTANYTSGDTEEREYWIKATNILIDCIEQYHGYAEGEMFDTLESNAIENYTLADHGLYISKNSANVYLAQIDINKEIPTIDTNSYIKTSDIMDLKDNLVGDGIAKLKKGKVLFYKYTVDNKDILIIGEQNDFSYIINKSIQSILNVMFNGDTKVVDYYKENYPSVTDNKQFEGFKIEVNPIKNSTEETVFGAGKTYQFARITMDREVIAAHLEAKAKEGTNPAPGTQDPGTPVTGTPGTGTPGTGTGGTTTGGGSLPNTGDFASCLVSSLYAAAAITTVGLIAFTYASKKHES